METQHDVEVKMAILEMTLLGLCHQLPDAQDTEKIGVLEAFYETKRAVGRLVDASDTPATAAGS